MKRVAKPKHNTTIEIPGIVRIRPVRTEPPITIIVTLDVEHVRVAIGVGLLLYRYLLSHYPLNTLGTVFYLQS